MSETVVARVDPTDLTALRWCGDASAWETGGFDEFAAALGQSDCVVLVDGAAVTLMDMALAGTDVKTARQASPYAVEERLAQPVDDIHLAVQPVAAGRYTVVAIDRDRIEALGLELKRRGIQPQLVTAEYFGLPYAEDSWSVAVEQEVATLRPARQAGIKVALSDLDALVPLLRREYPNASRVMIYSDGAPQAFPQAAFAGLKLEWRPALNAADMLAELAAQSPPVLLDASTTAQRRIYAARLWRATAAAAVVSLLMYPALLGWQHGVLASRERELVAANAALFSAAFPDITRVVNPRVQADQALAELRAQAVKAPRFLDLLARVDEVRARHFPPRTQVANAAFSGGVMELGIETVGMDAVELVRTALKEEGLIADTLSAESSNEAIVARLRVREEP